MPVAIGFHPYFQLTDSPRDDWTIAVGARTHWLLAANKIPTGETEPIERLFARDRRRSRCATSCSTMCSAISCATRRGDATMTVCGKGAAARRRLRPTLPRRGDLAPARGRIRLFRADGGDRPTRSTPAPKNLYRELESYCARSGVGERFWIPPGAGF